MLDRIAHAMKILSLFALSLLLVGCESKPKWELVTTKDRLVYRINKQTGDVSLVAGAQITKLEEFTNPKLDATKKSCVRDWPVQTVKSIGDVSSRLKTTWRDGSMHYILNVSPISPQVQKAKETAHSEARFNMNLYDSDGFELLVVPVKIQAMSQLVDDAGKPESLSATGSLPCSVETYGAFSVSGIGWAGFPKESQ